MPELKEHKANACSTYITIPHIITIQEAMKIFGIGRSTIDEAIQKSELPAYRPNGRKYLLDAEEVFHWIKCNRYDSGYHSVNSASKSE